MKKLLLALFAVFLLAGCLGGGATATPIATVEPTPEPTIAPTATPEPTVAVSVEPTPEIVQTNSVVIIYGTFDPVRIGVEPGTTVTWENQDSALPSVKAKDGSFYSGSIPARQTWSYTFANEGTFEYYDDLGGGKTGFVYVRFK